MHIIIMTCGNKWMCICVFIRSDTVSMDTYVYICMQAHLHKYFKSFNYTYCCHAIVRTFNKIRKWETRVEDLKIILRHRQTKKGWHCAAKHETCVLLFNEWFLKKKPYKDKYIFTYMCIACDASKAHKWHFRNYSERSFSFLFRVSQMLENIQVLWEMCSRPLNN